MAESAVPSPSHNVEEPRTTRIRVAEPTFTGAPTLLTIDEASFLTGINRETLYDAANAEQLPGARRIGGSFCVHRDTLLDWFRPKSRLRPPKSEARQVTGRAPENRVPSTSASERPAKWLTYEEAAAYTGWSLPYLRNLVSSGAIPVYGKPRSRRFRVDMLDLFLTDPDAAMRKFRLERDGHGS